MFGNLPTHDAGPKTAANIKMPAVTNRFVSPALSGISASLDRRGFLAPCGVRWGKTFLRRRMLVQLSGQLPEQLYRFANVCVAHL